MGKRTSFIAGTLLGTAIGLTLNYLFGPAQNTTFDEHYQSRLDRALADGEKAADEREAELRLQLKTLSSSQNGRA